MEKNYQYKCKNVIYRKKINLKSLKINEKNKIIKFVHNKIFKK